MAKKIEINENWEPIEVENLDDLFVVVFKHGSFDNGYIEAFDTDDVLMQSAYDSLAKQYGDCGCDELTKIYLIKVPNTEQTVNMCNTGLFNGNCCDPHVIEATRDLFNRADCEHLSCWEGCGLTENKKKKNIIPGGYLTITTGDPALNIKHFNKCMGTDGLGNPADHPHLVVGDTLPNGPVADTGSSDGASDASSSAGEGGAMGESLNEDLEDLKANATIVDYVEYKHSYCHVLEPRMKKINYLANVVKKPVSYIRAVVRNTIKQSPEVRWTDKEQWFMSKLNEFWPDSYELYKFIKNSIEKAHDTWVYVDADGELIPELNADMISIPVGESLNEDVTKELQIQDNENIEKDIEELEPPIDPEYFPNNMGINLSSVKKEIWVQQDDGQLKSVEVEFDPAKEVEESLTEAHLDYSTQLAKMRALEAGTRGFNAGSASLEKILFNYDICISHNLPKARKVMEDALRMHGWDRYIKPSKKQVNIFDYKLEQKDFIVGSAKIIWAERNNAQKLIDDYGNGITDMLIILIFALYMKQADLAGKIKDYILANFTVTLDDLKTWLGGYTHDLIFSKYINDLLINDKICEGLELDEDKIYSHRVEKYYELPSEIQLLDKDEVEKFISKLAPEELFKVGYVTPVYFYKELDKLFTLLKATELVGYTGMDYRDATGDANVADHADRLANARRQIDTYTDGAQGYQLNKNGEKFSATYKQTNKLTLNQKKNNYVNEYEYELDDNGNPKLDDKGDPIIKVDAAGQKVIKQQIDLSKILFYPKVGSKPKVIYYLDVGQGFKKVKREFLVDILYKKVQELAFAKDNNITDADRKSVQKLGFKDILDFTNQFPGMTLSDYKNALKMNMNPKDYQKLYPFSRRWSMKDFSIKVLNTLDQDSATISTMSLDATSGANRNVSGEELKPQVRALYTNQIYYLEGDKLALNKQPEKFGNPLQEDVQLDEAKRYVKRYYVRPLNIFCGNKEDIIQALIRAGDQNCSVYSLKNLTDHEDVHLLQPSDIIYYWDDRVLYDKNHVQVMDYDLFVKHEEGRKKVGNVDAMSDAAFSDMYDDRATEDDLKDKDVIANYKALNKITR